MPKHDLATLQKIARKRALPGLLVFDTHGTLQSWNPVARQILNEAHQEKELLQKIRSVIRNITIPPPKPKSSVPPEAGSFIKSTLSSGRRHYGIRAFFLDPQTEKGSHLVAVLLQQITPTRFNLQKAKKRFALSPREVEVIHSLLDGMTDKEIASVLGIRPETVRGYLKIVRSKLGVSTRTAILNTLLSL